MARVDKPDRGSEERHGANSALSEQPAPSVDGVALDDGYGVLIEPEPTVAGVGVIRSRVVFKTPVRLIAWLTVRDERGEYHKVRPLAPGSRVEWEYERRRILFVNGVTTIGKAQ